MSGERNLPVVWYLLLNMLFVDFHDCFSKDDGLVRIFCRTSKLCGRNVFFILEKKDKGH